VRGAGTVVTGTLWSGAVARGDTLAVLPAGRHARVRAVHVHDEPVDRAEAGQRVALNLGGVSVHDVARGDVVCHPEHGPEPTHRIDADLRLAGAPPRRVHVHHGARDAPGRLVALGGGLWQARLERPLFASRGDRVVVRAVSPPDTLGGGVVLDAHPRRHGGSTAIRARLEGLRAGAADVAAPQRPSEREREQGRSAPVPLSPTALALEARLLAAGHEPPAEAELGDAASELGALRAAGHAVRVGRSMYAHPDAIAAVRGRVEAIISAEGAITMARLRDELGTSRKYAQALLEHLDAARVTLRLPDNRRVLRRRPGA
jgi:selenocysteine-specific elongation factor